MNLKFACINLEVADPQRSKRLYIDAFGMIENERRSHPPGFVYLESPGANGAAVTLCAPRDDASAEPSRTMELGFQTDDLETLRAKLEAFGARDFRAQSMGWGEVLEGHDHDGHRIIVYRFRGD